jgi:glycosyltransferase involved in cell wall biosynthesis
VASRLVYVANARLPTEKAHGHAIVKMCEAYAEAGVEVELWHPYRAQGDARLGKMTVFDYYGVPETFRVRSLRNIDVIPAERWFPRRLFPYLAGAQDVLWTCYAAQRARRSPPALYHTRDLFAAYWLTQAGLSVILEVHIPPAGTGRRLIRTLARRPNLRGVIALTEGNRDALLSLDVPERKMLVLGSCVDTRSYRALPRPDECRDLLGLPDDRQIIGYVGRFQTLGKEKGLPVLLSAFGRLRKQHGLAPLLLGVGGPMDVVPRYIEAGVAAGAHPDDLLFVDRVESEDVPMWIHACDVGVIPSPRSEFFARHSSPLKAFEFMAAGVPLVASDLPALRESLTHDRNAWLVEPENPEALAAGLALLLGDAEVRGRLRAQAERDVTQHTWRHRADTIMESYRNWVR